MQRCFHYGDLVVGDLTLCDAESHHLRDVIRIKIGDEIAVLNGAGKIGLGVIKFFDRKSVIVGINKVVSCGERQLSILESASNALGEGGTLVYSTCTFSVYENENVIEKFLSSHKEFELIDCGVSFGKRSKEKCVRILPEHGGEGHFVAKLVKKGERYTNDSYCVNTKPFPEQKAALSLYDEILTDRIFGDKLCKFGDKIVILPKLMLPDTSGLSVIRAGVLLGEIKKSRIEPCHALYMASDREHLRNFIDLSYNDSRLKRFYHGEEIETDTSEKGFCAVLAEGVSTGFGKASGGVLKNRYPKGLRT